MSPTRMECSFHLASPAAQSCNELWVHMVHGDSHLPCLSATVMSGSPVFLACMNPAWKSLCPLHSAQSLFLQSEVVPGLSTGDVSHWPPLSGGKHMACFFFFFFPLDAVIYTGNAAVCWLFFRLLWQWPLLHCACWVSHRSSSLLSGLISWWECSC